LEKALRIRKKLRGYKWQIKRRIREYIPKRVNVIIGNSRSCVIFRLDDVGSDLIFTTSAVLDLFLKKNCSISLGLIMNSIDINNVLFERIVHGNKIGLFELALHGWDHADYSKLRDEEQHDSLCKASEKMQNLFGKASTILIPPFNSFNASTLHVMNKIGITTISSMLNYEVEKDIFKTAGKGSVSADTNSIYHLPETASFEIWDRHGHTIRVPNKRILNNIDLSIRYYGYAVVTLHPITFAKLQDANPVDNVDEHQINDLATLIDCIESKNILITSFSKLTSTQH
jgi:peptidoglycan/xylan/chitin deacetylase (PgdA/CDA1 family)